MPLVLNLFVNMYYRFLISELQKDAMKKYRVFSSIACVFVFVSAFIISTSGLHVHVEDLPTPVDGLSWTFYKETCPDLEDIVKSTLEQALDQDITQTAGLLRLHFHDCFVQGCDGSLLLTGSASNPSEQEAQPNLSLRARALQIIDEIKSAVEASCSGVVTCADVLALAARDSVAKAGGPKYPVPLGRRDSLDFASQSVVLANIPTPTSNLTQLLSIFEPKGFSLTDMIALSGGHTIGVAHCNSFDNRLYNISTGEAIVDPTLENSFASNLYSICPAVNNTVNTANLDVLTPNYFDNSYYVNVQRNQALFTSDQSLYTDSTDSGDIVDSFASKKTVFFKKFVLGMVQMGQLDVLTGSEGEIRSKCSVPNPTSSSYEEVIKPIISTGERSRSCRVHSEL
jgi:peroxidase